MGNRIIVKGADFSLNSIIEWHYSQYSNNYKGATFTSATKSNAGWNMPSIDTLLTGKTFNVIRCVFVGTGRLNFYLVNASDVATTTSQLSSPVGFIDVEEGDVGVLKTFELSSPITVETGKALVWGDNLSYGGNNSNCTINWIRKDDIGHDFYFKVGTSSITYSSTKKYIPFDIGILH